MRVLQINDDFQRLGGAETYFFNLIDLLEKKGHQIFVFALRGKDTSEVKYTDTSEVEIVGAPQGRLATYFSSKIFNFKVYFQIKNFLHQTKPDLIHLHNNYLAPFSVLLALRGQKVIQTVHDYKIICPYGEMVQKNNLQVCSGGIRPKCWTNRCLSFHNLAVSYLPFKLRNYLTKKIVGQFLSPSKKLKSYLETFGFQNVHHLPYFLKVKDYQLGNTPWAGKENGNILYLGRLVKTKGIDSLLRSLPKIISQINQANLTIIGEGPEKKALISLAKKLKIVDKVNFVGPVPHREVKKYYRQAKVVVIPSLCLDNSPNVIYEAFAAGCPVVASNRGGMTDFVKDEKTGFIFRSGNTQGLAQKIITTLKDDKLLQKMSLNCRQFALANFTPENHYQKIMKIYQK